MASKTLIEQPAQKVKPYYWVGIVIAYLLVPLVLWAFGRDPGWWQAWIYSTIIFIVGLGSRMLANRLHPGLMAERLKLGRATGVKAWDKVLSPLMSVSIAYPLYIVAGLDHHLAWSPVFPIWLNILGLVLCALGYGIGVWALAVNRFFSTTVRIQTERGHEVCDSGPYRYIRHPGYGGNILPLAGIVLALSSLWTLIPAAVALIIVVVRSELEDRTLQEELPGYRDYAQRVRYRLIPWIY